MSDGFEEGFPPLEERPAIPRFLIACPEPGLPTGVTLLGDKLIIRRKHWDQGVKRPIPCSGDPETCRYCLASMRTLPTGYMAAILTRGRRRVIFQLSESAILALREYKMRFPTLRGQQFLSERADNRRTSKQLLEFRGADSSENLPEEFDVRPTLTVMWGLAADRLLKYEELGVKPQRRQPRPRGER